MRATIGTKAIILTKVQRAAAVSMMSTGRIVARLLPLGCVFYLYYPTIYSEFARPTSVTDIILF